MIKVLEKKVADKIAAGEVIERSLSVIKELIENSIDAGATSIVCEIKKGGKEYIRVTDNGAGIPAEEVATAFLRHATSKIGSAGDLDAIRTLGFRGEALASIAAVSKLEIITKTETQKFARHAILEGGEIISSEALGAPDGTTITVKDLFFNMPARRKFLKSDASETSAVVDFISKMALAYPNINLRMISNESILFATNGRGNIRDNIMTVYGAGLGGQLLELNAEDGYMKLHGFIGRPDQSRKNRKHQVFFVNGRSISSGTLLQGLENAYRERLFEGQFPVAFLFLEIAPEHLDVNIHPNKKQIKFDDDIAVREFVTGSIRSLLRSDISIPSVEDNKNVNLFKDTFMRKNSSTSEGNAVNMAEKKIDYSPHEERGNLTEEPSIPGGDSVLRESVKSYPERELTDMLSELRKEVDTIPPGGVQETVFSSSPENFFSNMEVLGTIFSSYIITKDVNSLYLIDQHAAHERIYYERFMSSYRGEKNIPRQQLLLPIVINVSAEAKQAFADEGNRNVLADLGFGLAEFGHGALKLYELPSYMEQSSAQAFLDEFFDSLENGAMKLDPTHVDRLIMRSCKAAVKANDRLTSEEITQLLSDLANCENPHSCPHGRPTVVRFRKYDIEKMFKRV